MYIKEMISLFWFLNIAKVIFISSFLAMVCERNEVEKKRVEAKKKIAMERKPWEGGLEHPVLRMVCCVDCWREGNLVLPEDYTLMESGLFLQGWGLDDKGRPLCPDHRSNVMMIDAI